MFPICIQFSRVHVRCSPECRNPHAVPLFNLGYMFRIIGMLISGVCLFCLALDVAFILIQSKNKIGLKSARNYLTTLCPLKNTLYHYKDILPNQYFFALIYSLIYIFIFSYSSFFFLTIFSLFKFLFKIHSLIFNTKYSLIFLC